LYAVKSRTTEFAISLDGRHVLILCLFLNSLASRVSELLQMILYQLEWEKTLDLD